MHVWYLYESGMYGPVYENMSPVGPVVMAVMFDRRSECWTCDCAPNDLQPSLMGQVCDHVYKVCKQLVVSKGPWEQDAELMQKAWDAVRPRVRREENSKNYYEDISKLMSNAIDAQSYNALLKGTSSSMDTSTSTDGSQIVRVIYDETKGVQFTIDGEDVTKDVKTAKIGKSYAGGEIVTVTLNGEPYKNKFSGLKADKLIVDELNEHKEPEKPKKKKSRFTEIDL